jgi:hypothetical protein
MGLDKQDIKQLILILQKGLEDDEKTAETQPKKINTKKRTPSNNVKNKKEIVSNTSENKFLTMGVHNLHKEDIEIDRALKKNPPTPRNRNFKNIDVRCRVCGKSEAINPSLLYEAPDRYKCNKCCSSPG